jgi:hypothetical protein
MPQQKSRKTKVTKQNRKKSNKFVKAAPTARKVGLNKPKNSSPQRRAFLRLKRNRARRPRRKRRLPRYITNRFLKLVRARSRMLVRFRRLLAAHRELGRLFSRRSRRRSVRRRHTEVHKQLSRVCRSF